MKITIGIITYKRPQGLDKTLHSLINQEYAENLDIRIIVVDNEGSNAALLIVEKYKQKKKFRIDYYHEPDRGIPQARNRVVSEFWNKDSEALLFIDDDEEATPNWIQELTSRWISSKADIVTGPVIQILPDITPAWAKTAFSSPRKYVSGQKVNMAYTGNILISRKVLDKIRPAFHPSFRFTGSEDHHFALSAVKKGFKIVWEGNAVVTEPLPSSRISLIWLMKRLFRAGSGDAKSQYLLYPKYLAVIRILFRGSARITYGLFFMLAGAFRIWHWPWIITGYRRFFSGLGTFAGLFGIKHQEYSVIHGS